MENKEGAISDATKNRSMTEEERLQLCEKLDKELDDWIDGLEKKQYTDGWPEDKWEEEMEKHPFFMGKFSDNTKNSPLIQGLQQLKYDEADNTPLELALSYKEDGNFNFKHKKYRMAVISYTEGLRRKCDDPEMNATLYNNRAAAQFFIGNYRSSLMDCRNCLKLNPIHDKAEARAAQCCYNMKLTKEAISYCDSYLKRNPDNEEMKRIRREAIAQQNTIDRDRRKSTRKEEKEKAHFEKLEQAIAQRKVRVDVNGDPHEVLQGMHERPKLTENGSLTWPVFFLYPEYSTSDFIQEFNEDVCFQDILDEIFTETPEWDIEGKYKLGNIAVYYEGIDRSHMHSVNIKAALGEVLKGKEFVARDWRPAFLIFVKNSIAETNFLKNYTVFP